MKILAIQCLEPGRNNMDTIKLMKNSNPSSYIDQGGKLRWVVLLENGKTATKARWMMMNFLHTLYIPRSIHVHHINGIADDDRLDNFELLTASDHAKLHQPRDNSRFGVSATDEPILYGRLSATAWYYAHKEDIDFLETRKRRKREYTAIKRQDPEWREKNAAYSREYRKLHRDDPVFREKNRIYLKEYYKRKREEKINAATKL